MKSFVALLALVVATTVSAFQGASSFTGSSMGVVQNGNKMSMEYIRK